MSNQLTSNQWDKHFADTAALVLALVVVIYAASGPIGEFVKWFIELTTPEFEELSRRDKRVLLKTHWLGAVMHLSRPCYYLQG